MDKIQQQIDTFVNSLGFEEMEAGTYRKDNIDIFLKVQEHSNVCVHFNCNNQQVEGTDSCINHQFCNCDKVQGKHYMIAHDDFKRTIEVSKVKHSKEYLQAEEKSFLADVDELSS